MDISFKTITNFLGRNGTFKCSGINITKFPLTKPKPEDIPYITLAPITSKSLIGRSMIEIPLANIPELIEALQKEMDDSL